MHTPEQKTEIVTEICNQIANGVSVETACKGKVNKKTFYEWVKEPDLSELWENAKKSKVETGNEIAIQGMLYRMRPYIEETEIYTVTPNDDPKQPPIQTLVKIVRRKKAPCLQTLSYWLKHNHPDFNPDKPKNAEKDDDEIMDWSEPDQPGTRIIK